MKKYFKLIFLLYTLLFIKTNEAQNELIFNTKSNIIFKDSISLNDSIIFNEKKINPNIKFSLRDSSLYIPIIETEPKFLNQNNYKKIDSEILTSGSFARGFANGNNQNFTINTDVDLKISGKINDNLFIDGFISDNSIPLQYGESSSSLQELDKIYIKIYNSKTSLTGGDIDIKNIDNHFLKFTKKSIGLDFLINDSTNLIKSSIGISKNNFKRQEIIVQNGNQGPYKLYGENNEPYIIVIPDTEQVFIDGEKKTRGSEKDYEINYNTGEISFTNNIILNENNRVIIEFQYTSLDYLKWLGYAGFYKKKENIEYYFNFYNESDNKNNPINPYTDNEISQLNYSGDNNILINNFEPVNFNPELQQILYSKKDTVDSNNILYKEIFVYSNTNKDSLFQVNFANVGDGNGNYILDSSLINGTVFKWIEPVNGEPQGNYSPSKILIPAEKKQMFAFGSKYKQSNTQFSLDFGVSNYDKNLYSDLEDQDNFGFASKFAIDKIFSIRNTSIIPKFEYEYINKNFSFIERNRDVEFNRNWNLDTDIGDQQLINFSLNTIFKKGKLNYTLEKMKLPNSNKIRNSISGLVQKNQWKVNFDGSLLSSKSNIENLFFLTHKNSISKEGDVKFNFSNEGELLENGQNTTSFNKLNISSSITNFIMPEIKIGLTNRVDKNKLVNDGVENSIFLKSRLFDSERYRSNFQISVSDFSTYYQDSTINENSFSSKLDYFINISKLFKINGSYEISNGQEALREIRYVKVNDGYGNYTWVDYNNNQIEEYNEFEISHFSDTADYMQISFPTNEYFNVKNTRVSQQIQLKPYTKKTKGLLYKLTFFENLINFEVNRKLTSNNWEEILIPFIQSDINNVLSLKFNFNNTLIYQPKNKNIFLSYKIDNNIFRNSFRWDKKLSENIKHNIGCKLNLFNLITQTNIYFDKVKLNNDNLFNQNYLIDKKGFDLEIGIKNKFFKPSIIFNYYTKKNRNNDYNLKGFKISPQLKLNGKNNLSFSSNFTLYRIDYSGELNNAISYQMLEGLSTGNGLKWSTIISKKINKLLFSLKYSGELNSVNDVHYAQIEFKKYF
tara:strand:+ start:88303 stop:91512 length:3210 start_codon:yes stop_codon:yes gene_type:complete